MKKPKKEDVEKYKEYKKKRIFVITLCIIIIAMIYFFKDASFILRTTTTISLILIFYIIDHFFDIKFKRYHYLFIIIIAIGGALLSPLFYVYPNYDKIQHLIFPILIFTIVFHMIKGLDIRLKLKLTFTFFITVALLGLFEIGEYALDLLFNMKLQGVYLRDIKGIEKLNLIQDPIDDTMIDMLLGVIGSSIYALFMGYKFRRKLKLEEKRI